MGCVLALCRSLHCFQMLGMNADALFRVSAGLLHFLERVGAAMFELQSFLSAQPPMDAQGPWGHDVIGSHPLRLFGVLVRVWVLWVVWVRVRDTGAGCG